MSLKLTRKEEADIRRRRAAKGRSKLAGPKIQHGKTKERRERDLGYLGWLHDGLPCVACLVLGPSSHPREMEAAHQKLNAPAFGVQKRLGVRPPDMWCLPLCAGHHRLDPQCCDPAQTKFWLAVGLSQDDVAELCLRLYAAFQQDDDGAPIIRDFASLAVANVADRSAA